MDDLKIKIESNPLLTIVVCLAIGVALHYGYELMLVLLYPVAIFIVQFVIDPYSQHILIQTAILNILLSALCGLLVALLLLYVMQVIIRPVTMFYSQVAALPYVVLSYWWFVSDIDGFTRVATKEHIWIILLSPLAAIIMWLVCSLWLVHKNSPNQVLNKDAAKNSGAC
jgi:hypothetical protein